MAEHNPFKTNSENKSIQTEEGLGNLKELENLCGDRFDEVSEFDLVPKCFEAKKPQPLNSRGEWRRMVKVEPIPLSPQPANTQLNRYNIDTCKGLFVEWRDVEFWKWCRKSEG